MTQQMEDLIKRAAQDLAKSKYAVALTGAGISTESGIPDFRGPDGIWTKNPEAESRAYEIYDQFQADPARYWKDRLDPEGPIARIFDIFGEIEKAQPNPGHHALAQLEQMGILKWVITQNVDGLHQKAGNRNVMEYHGGLNKFRCMSCNRRFLKDELDLEKIREEGRLPPRCPCGGVIKDDGVFFGEPIPGDVMQASQEEAWKCDAMLICGTSAVVTPFAYLPRIARQKEPTTADRGSATVIIEVNYEPTPLTHGRISDYLIQGRTGEILPKLVEAIRAR